MINTQAQAPRIPHGLFGLNQDFGVPVPETFMGNFLNNNPPPPHHHNQINIPHQNYLPSNSTTTTSVFSSSEANSDLELLQTNMNSFGSIPHGQWINYRYNDQQEMSMPMLTQGVLKLEQEENNKMNDLSHLYYQNQLQGGPSHVSMESQSTTRNMNNGNNSAPPNIVEIKKLFKQGNHAGNLNEDQLSLTRDFLGVGVGDDSLKKPLLHQQEVPRFNPIGPVMNMQSDQFGGHY